jgi:hypothetical protein
MSPKTLLIILVVIALVVGVAIVRGQRHEKASDRDAENPPGEDFFLFKWLSGGGDSLAISRMVGCHRDGRTLRWSGTCDASILTGKPRQSRFVLRASVGVAKACYGFTEDQLKECDDKGMEEKSTIKADGKSRFVVGQDKALLRLYCVTPVSGGCAVTVE